MTVKEIGIILHGATGRIGATQHLANALAPIRAEGGLPSGTGRIMPRLLLVGRNPTRLTEIARRHDVTDWTQNLDEALGRTRNRAVNSADRPDGLRVGQYAALPGVKILKIGRPRGRMKVHRLPVSSSQVTSSCSSSNNRRASAFLLDQLRIKR